MGTFLTVGMVAALVVVLVVIGATTYAVYLSIKHWPDKEDKS